MNVKAVVLFGLIMASTSVLATVNYNGESTSTDSLEKVAFVVPSPVSISSCPCEVHDMCDDSDLV